jgi:hypothetical protein
MVDYDYGSTDSEQQQIVGRGDRDSTTTVAAAGSPTQKILFWSLAVAIPMVPIWIVAGRTLFGVENGWYGGVLTFTVAPMFLFYHIVLFALAYSQNEQQSSSSVLQQQARSATRRNRNRDDDDDDDNCCSFWEFHSNFQLSRRTCQVLILYYLSHIGYQLFVEDGGVMVPSASVMELHFSDNLFTKDQCATFANVFAWSTFILMYLLLNLICWTTSPNNN